MWERYVVVAHTTNTRDILIVNDEGHEMAKVQKESGHDHFLRMKNTA